MNELINKLLDTGILIGSRQWGGDTINSDYDLVYSTSTAKNILKYFKKSNIEYTILGGSSENKENTMFNELNVKVNLDGSVFNIISYPEDKILNIVDLNEYMSAIENIPLGIACKDNKNIRIHVVESYLNYAFGNVKEYTESKKEVPTIDLDEDNIPLGAMWDGNSKGSMDLL